MGKGKRRNTAKTGDVAIYKSRENENNTKNKKKQDDDDNMYNEIDRYHNDINDLQKDMLKFNKDDDSDNTDDENGDFYHERQQENVFDLGLNDEEDDDSTCSDDDENAEDIMRRRKDNDDSDDDSDDDVLSDDEDNEDSSIEGFDRPEKTDILNWGKWKKNYYHGDTADLELGQEVEDAELEEEAGREVLKTRMENMAEEDFMLDDDDDDDEDEKRNDAKDKSKTKISLSSAMTATMHKNLAKLTKKEKLKLLDKLHPELLPLLKHFQEESIRPCVNETLVVVNAMFQSKDNAEAVGATKDGLKYLITKAMIETSTALNVCQYLLIKAEHAKISGEEGNGNEDESSNNNIFLDDNLGGDDIKNHPVITRLNQLNHLREKLYSDVELKVKSIKTQMDNLVKASTLMLDDNNATTEESSVGSQYNNEKDVERSRGSSNQIITTTLDRETEMNDLDYSRDYDSDDDPNVFEKLEDDKLEDSTDGEEENGAQIQRNIMNEARFALRAQDDNHHEGNRVTKRRRRSVPISSDYGDEADANPTDLDKAARALASTINTISQRNKKSSNVISAEMEDDHNEDRFLKGLEMMEKELGDDSDDEDVEMDDDDQDLDLEDDDDFYSQIKKKSKEKKDYKKSLYAVAPKYPGMDEEIEGERAVGRMIMKNRGLVAHKAKINRNPRVKKREQYRKAIIRRKGAVRDVRTDEGHRYGGEQTGIKSGLSRSRKL